ncbi:MAG: AAA family ATPase [Actinomycetes bacterium]
METVVYAPTLALDWRALAGDRRHLDLDGSLLFADVSGFTRLSERLARGGRVGGEAISEIIDDVFTRIIQPVLDRGGDVLQFSGDALLVLLHGEAHEARASAAALEMQRALDAVPTIRAPGGAVRLRMSIGLHSGQLGIARLGVDQEVFLALGPGATATCMLEKAAASGEVLVSDATAAALPVDALRSDPARGALLRRHRRAIAWTERVPDPPIRPVGAADAARAAQSIPLHLRGVLGAEGLDGEHRPLAVGFVGVRRLDDEIARWGVGDVVARLETIAERLEDAQRQFGVNWFGCDAMPNSCSFFVAVGAPVMHDDDEDRLLHALSEVCGMDVGLDLAAGANRGHVFAAEIGHPRRRTFSVTGDPVNVAARVMAHAQAGELLATDPLLELADRSWTRAERPAFRAKGKARPVPVSAVSGRASVGSGSGTAIGRDAELDRVRAALAIAGAGAGAVIEISGPTGIGKSTVLDAVVVEHVGPLVRVTGEAYRDHDLFGAWRAGLREAVPEAVGDGEEAGAGLRRWLRALDRDLEPWASLIGDAFGLDIPPSDAVRTVDPQFLGEVRVARVAEALAAHLPVGTLIAVDDLHWLDEASVALVERLGAEALSRGWVCIVTRRDDLPDRLDPAVERTTLTLGPISAADAEVLAIRAAGTHGLSDDRLASVLALGQGNPFLVEELARSSTAGRVPLSDRIERVIGAQMDDLAPGDRTVLREVAVLGVRNPISLVVGVVDALEGPADPRLTRLDRYLDVGEVVRFRHDLFRAVAYEGLSFRRRRTLHGKAADVLVATTPAGSADDLASVIALHYDRARRHPEAWEWSLRAARRADGRAAMADAVTFYRQALAASAHLPDVPMTDRAEVAERMGDVAEIAGEPVEARAAYAEARRHLRGQSPLAIGRICRKQGYVDEKTDSMPGALRWYRRAVRELEVAPEGPDREREARRARIRYGATRIHQGRYAEGRRLVVAEIDGAQRSADDEALGQAFTLLEIVAAETGAADRQEFEELGIAAFERSGDRRGLAILHLNVGGSATNEGRVSDAERHFAAAADLANRIGHANLAAIVSNNRADLYCDQGRYADAEPLLVQALRAQRAVHDALGAAISLMCLGQLLVRTDRVVEGIAALDEAVAAFVDLGIPAWVRESRVRRAEADLSSGDPVAALRRLDEAEQDSGPDTTLLQTITVRSLRALARSQLGEGHVALRGVLTAADAAGAALPFARASCLDLAGRVAAAHGIEAPEALAELPALMSRLEIERFAPVPVIAPSA